MLEVELKAWADLDAARRRLEALGKKPKQAQPSVKDDRYFCAPEADPKTCDATRDRIVRIRLEGERAILTAKRKKVEQGVETSQEIELTVEPAEEALALLDYMGYRQFLEKRKESRTYRWAEGMNVELNTIEGLGDFVEIEALVPEDTAPAEVEKVRQKLREVVRELGIAEAKIEPRPYMDLLRK